MLTTNYVGICIDPDGSNYTVGSELLAGARLDRKVNTPSSFQFKVDNPGAAVINTYAPDDKIEFHVGTEPLYQWGSLSALSFDGTGDYVDVSSLDGYVNGRGYLTIELWVKYTVASDGKGLAGWWYVNSNMLATLANRIYMRVGMGVALSDAVLNDGAWHHVVGTYDKDLGSANVKLYVDGVQQTDTGDQAGNMVSADKFNIANINDDATNTYTFTGIIDEVRIYNRALSASEVLDAYKGTHSSTGLVAYWDFDEGYGTTATDESTNTNDGTIYGATWVNPKIMSGFIMDIDLERQAYGGNVLTISGEDYLTVLGERLCRGTFPGSVDVATILINILTDFASGEYTTTNVTATLTTVTNFTVGAQTTILALMRRLAELPGTAQDFYLDGGNDLVWHNRGDASWNSGVTLSETNIRRMVVNRSTKEKKTYIHITGAQTPVEEAINRQSTITDSVTLDTNYYSDDFIAQHDNLMAIDLYLQKVGTPGTDLTGRIAIAKYDMPSGDFLAFTLREESITTAGWYRISTPMNTQVGSRYFIRLDKVGANSSNTYKWYGDTPAVLDTERKAKVSTDGIYWTAADYDFATKVYYGEYAEVEATNAATPKREGVVPLPNNSGIDTVQAQKLADQILYNYLQTAFKATVRFDCPSTELKPSYLITLDETGDGLASKTYRVERVTMEFGVNRACDYYDIDISATLPYTYLGEEDSKLREALLTGGGGALESGASGEITTAKVGYAKVDYSYASVYPDEG